jgi:hypothetical protein
MATPATAPAHEPVLPRLQQRALAVGIVGLLAGIAGAFLNVDKFFQSWLLGFLFCLGLTIGSLGLLMLQHMSGGQWGLVGRRVWEAATRTLWVVALMFVPLIFGLPKVFEWARPEAVQASHILQMKAPYLNPTFFIIRAVIYFAFWMACAWLLNAWSLRQDRGEVAIVPSDTVRFRKVSAPGLLFLVLTITFASVDWIMSLDPEWFSTIFGLLTTVSWGLSGIALAIAVLASLSPVQPLAPVLTARHFHDLGKLLLAFVMLWAYLAFSQFLIIWSGNLPEEIPWYLERLRGGWGYVSLLLLLGHFVLPFVLLLSRDLKRNRGTLAKVAVFLIVMRFVDTIWLVGPAFEHHGFPIHWMHIVLPLGMAGIWLFLFVRQLGSRALLPLNDPYFKEAFAHDAH